MPSAKTPPIMNIAKDVAMYIAPIFL